MNQNIIQKTRIGKIKVYVVNGEIFQLKRDLEDFIKSILHSYPLRSHVSSEHLDFLLDVLSNHPDAAQKIGCGVAAMEVRINPRHQNNRCFWIIRNDNSETDWSFNKCIYPVKPFHLFHDACRHAVVEQIKEFKSDWVKLYADTEGYITCPVTQERILPSEAHVDHIPPDTFEAITRNFIKDRNIDVSNVELSEVEDGMIGRTIIDVKLLLDWQSYHRQIAKLRVVSKAANLSIIRHQSREL